MQDALSKLTSQGEQGSTMARQVAEFMRHLPPPETALDGIKRELREARTHLRAPAEAITAGGSTPRTRGRSR